MLRTAGKCLGLGCGGHAVQCPVTDGDSETHSYNEFVRPVSIGNEVWLYVLSEGEILPVGMRPLYRQDKDACKEKDGEYTYSEQPTQPKAQS